MKIAIDARLYGEENGGLGRYVKNLVTELMELDNENRYAVILRSNYFKRLRVPKHWEKVELEVRHYSAKEQVVVSKVLKKLEPDLVHFPHFNVPLLYRGEYVVTIHDILMHKVKGKDATTLPKYKYIIKRLGYKKVFSNAVKNANKILVPSIVAKKDLVNYYKLQPEQVVVTYEGFDAGITYDGSQEALLRKYGLRKPYFLYVGNAYPHKNLTRLIEAAKFLNGRGSRAKLAISTARNVFSDRLQREITRLGANEDVKILGFVPDKEVGGLMEHSHAFVYPSLIEGFGLQGLEAISNGTILLASDIPVFKEVYKDNAIYFNPHDFSAIEKAMRDALDLSLKKRKLIIQKAQKHIKKYSWDKMAKETLAVYKQAN